MYLKCPKVAPWYSPYLITVRFLVALASSHGALRFLECTRHVLIIFILALARQCAHASKPSEFGLIGCVVEATFRLFTCRLFSTD